MIYCEICRFLNFSLRQPQVSAGCSLLFLSPGVRIRSRVSSGERGCSCAMSCGFSG